MQKLVPAALYAGIVGAAVGGILRIAQVHILGVGPKSFTGFAALCFLFAIAASSLPKKAS